MDEAGSALNDATIDLSRVDGRFRLRRRPFPEAVRYALGVAPDLDDGDVLAEIVLLRQKAGELGA